MSHITENIYLGSYDDAIDHNFLTENKITLILNFAKECEYDSPLKKIDFKFSDNYTEKISDHFNDINEIISNHIIKNENILLHCFAGKSRSASFVIAYLMNSFKMDLKTAFDFLKSKRKIMPNIFFVKELLKYESSLTKSESKFNFDEYTIEFIQDITDLEIEKIKYLYKKSNNDFDKTLDKIYES